MGSGQWNGVRRRSVRRSGYRLTTPILIVMAVVAVGRGCCYMSCLKFALCCAFYCLRFLGWCLHLSPLFRRSSHLAHAVHRARFAALVSALSGLALVGVDDGDAGELVG